MKNSILLTIFSFLACVAQAQIITTIAGKDTVGYNGDNIAATAAELNYPKGVCLDKSGNLYIADAKNYRIRKVTPSGIITTIAGIGTAGYSGDNGPATLAQLSIVTGVKINKNGEVIFADGGNSVIRKISLSGIITTIAGTGVGGYNGDNIAATAAQLVPPADIALDTAGNLYIADEGNNRIRKVNTAGIITTIAGTGTAGYSGDNGPATAARLNVPCGIAVDKNGNILIADGFNYCIRKIDASGKITTITGNGYSGYGGDNGPASAARLMDALGVNTDRYGNIYICDATRIRKINTSGTIFTIAGNGILGFFGDGGLALNAEFYVACKIALDSNANMYVSDDRNGRIRYITTTVGLDQKIIQKEQLLIFPNPVTDGKFVVEVSALINDVVLLDITNMLGKQVKQIKVTANHPTEVSLDAPPGMYFISVKTSDNIFYEKIIIQR